jgi:DNA-binding beta-propeller fold protein YncE
LRFVNQLARCLRLLPALAPVLLAFPATAAFTNFVNFETPPVHPVALGPDGHTLAVCNLPDNRVELFDVSSGIPIPTGSVPVGLDPVTARFASSNELWVVNYISSSISVVGVLLAHECGLCNQSDESRRSDEHCHPGRNAARDGGQSGWRQSLCRDS